MKYTSLDKVIKGYLLQKKYPIHWYIDFLIYAVRCFEEISMDTIGNVRTLKLTINSYAAVTLPDDYMDWIKIGLANRQFVKPMVERPGMNRLNNFTNDRVIATLGTIVPGSAYTNGVYTGINLTGGLGNGATGTVTIAGNIVTTVVIVNPGNSYAAGDILSALQSDLGGTGSGFSVPVATIASSGKILYPDIKSTFSSAWPWYGYGVQWNDRLEYTGRHYGAASNRTDSFSVIPERNEIQLHDSICANDIILEYISDGSEIDNATQITPYAKKTLEASMSLQEEENKRNPSIGLLQLKRRKFDYEHGILRGRNNPMTISDFRGIIYKNSKGSPK